MKSEVPSEHYEQVCFINWWEEEHPNILIYAIPNGGKRHPATARKLKLEGVRAGIPDTHAPELRLWIEMKRTKGGSLSIDQKKIIAYLRSIGDTVIVGKGFIDAVKQTNEFMQTNRP